MLSANEAYIISLRSLAKEKIKAFGGFHLFSELDKIFQKIYSAALDGETSISINLSRKFSEDQIRQIVENLGNCHYGVRFEGWEAAWVLWITWG